MIVKVILAIFTRASAQPLPPLTLRPPSVLARVCSTRLCQCCHLSCCSHVFEGSSGRAATRACLGESSIALSFRPASRGPLGGIDTWNWVCPSRHSGLVICNKSSCEKEKRCAALWITAGHINLNPRRLRATHAAAKRSFGKLTRAVHATPGHAQATSPPQTNLTRIGAAAGQTPQEMHKPTPDTDGKRIAEGVASASLCFAAAIVG